MAGKANVVPVLIPAGEGGTSEMVVLETLVVPIVFVPESWEDLAKIILLAAPDRSGPYLPMCDDLGALIALTPLADTTYEGQGCAMRCEERLLQHVRYVKFRASTAQSEAKTIFVQTLPARDLVAAQQ